MGNRTNRQNKLAEDLNLVVELSHDGLDANDIIRRAKTKLNTSGNDLDDQLIMGFIEQEEDLVLNPLNRYRQYVEKDGGYFIKAISLISIYVIAGFFVTVALVWPITQYDVINNQSTVWLVATGYFAISVIAGSFFASRSEQERILEIVNRAFKDGAIHESLNHYAREYKKALDKVKQNAKSK